MALVRRTQTTTVDGSAQAPMELPRPTAPLHIMEATMYAVMIFGFLALVYEGLKASRETPIAQTALLFVLAPLIVAGAGLLIYMAIWFALMTAPYAHALRELLAGRDLDDSGDVGDVEGRYTNDGVDGLVDMMRGALEQKGTLQVQAKSKEFYDDGDLLHFTRQCLHLGLSHAKNKWTGEAGKRELPSKRNLTYTDWRTLLIQPNVQAGNMTLDVDSGGREHPKWVVTDWVEAAERLVQTGYLRTVKTRLTEKARMKQDA